MDNMGKKYEEIQYKLSPDQAYMCAMCDQCPARQVETCQRNGIKKVGIAGKNCRRVVFPVPVEANGLDIRDLTPWEDGVAVYGFDGCSMRPIRTDKEGRIEVVVRNSPASSPVIFNESKFLNIVTGDGVFALPAQDTSQQITYSYAVVNHGSNPAIVSVEISPDSVHFAFDREQVVQPNNAIVMVPTRFLRFTRVTVRNQNPGMNTQLDIFYQTQTYA